MADIKMEAAIVFEPFLPNALQRALNYAGVDGKLPDGREIPVYLFDEFKRRIADLRMHYGVILDFEL